jgi:exonuclease SbcD
VVGGEVSEEDELGGAGLVPARIFDGFDYTALGHLHGAHPVGRTCRYSGSPLKHSFNEIGDEKTVALVELREKGEVLVECVPLHPLRDLREVRGTYDEVVHTGLHDPAKEDYIRVVLTDEEDILDAAVKLRVVYPNLMRLAYDNRRTREYREIGGSAADVPEDGTMRPEDVFAELFELQNNVPPDEELLDVVRGIFETCEEVECE